MFCNNCGTEIGDSLLFCPNCGTKVEQREQNTPIPEEHKFCPNCGSQMPIQVDNCENCGFQFGVKIQDEQAVPIDIGKKKFNKILISLITVVGAVILICFCISILMGKSENNLMVYVKDNTLTTADKSGKKLTEVSDRFLTGLEDSISDRMSWEATYFGGQMVKVSADGKYIFYPEKMDINSSVFSFTLYYKKTGKEDAEKTKIAANVEKYEVTKDNKIIYVTEDGNLYIHDLKENQKIASDVLNYQIDDSFENVLWYTKDHNLYYRDLKLKNDKKKIASEVDKYITDIKSFNKILYVKKDILYEVVGLGSDPETITKEADTVYLFRTDSSVGAQYTKKSDAISRLELLDDDMAEDDRDMHKPKLEDYQRVEIEEGYWGNREVVTTDERYYEKVDKYQEKERRDEFRKSLVDAEKLLTVEIYRYQSDLGEPVKVNTSLVDYYNILHAVDGTIIYEMVDPNNCGKVKLSEMEDFSTGVVTANLRSRKTYMLANKGESVELPSSLFEYNGFVCYSNDKGIYYKTEGVNGEVAAVAAEETYTESEDEEGQDFESQGVNTLYKIDYAGNVEVFDEDVEVFERVINDKAYYFKDVEGRRGDLYCDGELIENEVAIYSVNSYDENKDSFFYATEPSSDKLVASLNYYNGRNKVKIADDVTAYYVLSDKRVGILVDFSFNSYIGDLKLYSGKKKLENIDNEVSVIMNSNLIMYY